jgi:Family of unknown function (DUF6518)
VRIAIAAGLALGVVSRIEEVVDGFDLGISSNETWLLTAFVVGALAGIEYEWSGLAGAAALTAANSSYYVWIALTEQATELDLVAGPVASWYALGVTGGFVFGVAGALARLRRFPPTA